MNNSIVQFLESKRTDQNENARNQSIASGKMLPKRDSTDAIRYAGRGLKVWEGNQASLQSLGFKKTEEGL